MLKKLAFLLALCTTTVVVADDVVIPSDATKFANSCNIGNLGVDAGNASNYFVALWGLAQYSCDAGQYLYVDDDVTTIECRQCPSDNFCTGGSYTIETAANSKIECPTGMVSPAGSGDSGACGRKLHIGDQYVYLRSEKKTTPSLNIDIDNDGVADFFGNATLQRTPINSTSSHYLHVGDYYIYDDSVKINE